MINSIIKCGRCGNEYPMYSKNKWGNYIFQSCPKCKEKENKETMRKAKSVRTRGFEVVSKYADDNVVLPVRGTSKSAGYDIRVVTHGKDIKIAPHSTYVFSTGIKAYMPSNEVLMIYPRSSVGFKKHLMFMNTVAIIDADYYNNADNEGHIMIGVYNYGDKVVTVQDNERIAQGIFTGYGITDDDSVSKIRVGGIGSTNK